MQISLCAEEDVPLLDRLVNSAYRGEDSKKGWTTEADLLAGIRTDSNSLKGMLDTAGAVILKATADDGSICGCVYLEKQGTRMYLGMLTVSPQMQAAGIGKRLLNAAEDYAAEAGCTVMAMTVISVRNELIAWYKRRGYHSTGETKPFPTEERFGIAKQPLEFIVMEKSLRKGSK